jgi:hypothetical protein
MSASIAETGRPSHEPGLRFWLHYAEREGALIEDAGDQALAVLPPALQEAADLPEDVAVTSDPDVAREDGAVLLIPGHPALERAAAAVLEEGDVGRVHLAWPRFAPTRMADLQARVRERFHVEHGRIDAAGDARRVYLPLLRVGAMISYAASLTHRLQEQEHVWVDARTGVGVPDGVLEALAGRPWLPEPDTRHTPLDADLALALRGAHAQIEERATARRAALHLQARRALESELARADAYYEGVLEAIERRRASAGDERRRLLDSQADATRAEHIRRRREIAEEFEACHEIHPFRLHLVLVPALVLPVDIRRGARTFPFEFVWLLPARAFADVRCPHCGAATELVAGRDRLGCRECTRTAAAQPQLQRQPADGPKAARESPPAVAAPRRGGARTPSPPAGQASADGRRNGRGDAPGRLERTGNKLALTFWQTVAGGSRWPRTKMAPDSPLRALYRLFGPDGPLCALGIPGGRWPSHVTTATYPHASGGPQLTIGHVEAGRISYPYALQWWLEAGKPLVGEVVPAAHPALLATPEAAARLHDRAPTPCIELDPVSAALWRRELSSTGLSITVRCLATWWRVRDAVDPSHATSPVAAAIAGAVARAAGLRRRRHDTAAAYGTDPDAVDRVVRDLGGHLRLDRHRGW